VVPGISVHRADHRLEPADRAPDLEGELRNPVAEIFERQPLEHHIGEAAIGGRMFGASFATISASGAVSRSPE
jgi:hypothetical protein